MGFRRSNLSNDQLFNDNRYLVKGTTEGDQTALGSVTIEGALALPAGASSGYVLTSDASGVASWQYNQGSTGLRGSTGIQGPSGVNGATGLQGQSGSQGLTGIQGNTGSIGFTGVQGITGSIDMIRADGGFANSTYLPIQHVDGGGASG